jgi:hypothetical protein
MLRMCATTTGQSTTPALGGLQVGSKIDALLVECGRWIWFASVHKNEITLLRYYAYGLYGYNENDFRLDPRNLI